MQKVYSKGFNGWSQLAILLSLVGGGMLIGAFAGAIIWAKMTGGNILNIETDMLNPANYQALQTVQGVSVLLMFLIPTVAFAFICYRNGWAYLGFKEKLKPQYLLIVILLIFCSLPLVSLLEQLNRWIPLSQSQRLKFDNMEIKYNAQVMAMAQVKTWGQYISALLIIAILPAVSEELIFRGALQNMLSRWTKSPWLAIFVTSVLFSAIHMSWYGFLPRFALGMVLGSIFYYTGNIWLNILLHFCNNALVVTMMFITSKRGEAVNMTSGDDFPLWVGLLGAFLVILLIGWLVKSAGTVTYEEVRVGYNSKNPFEDNENV